jgi:putative ABC transport system permease protein
MKRARADGRCVSDEVVADGIVGQIATDDPTLVSAVTTLTGARLDAALATLRAGGVLTEDADYVENGRATINIGNLSPSSDSGPALAPVTVPAYIVPVGGPGFIPILSPALLQRVHVKPVSDGLLVRTLSVPSQARQDQLREALSLSGVAPDIVVESGHHQQRNPVPLMLAIAAGVIALGAAGIATGLAAADSRHDLRTLAAVGATPWIRRGLSLAQSGIISGIGALLGSAAGFGAAAAVLTGINQQYANEWPGPPLLRITVPWLNFGISLIAAPLIAMAAAGLLTRSRLPSERRTG